MEFKAIVDAKARSATRAARWSACTRTVSWAPPRARSTRKSAASSHGCTPRAISAQSWARRCCCRIRQGAAAQRVLLIGLGLARGLRAQAVPQGAAVERVRRCSRPAPPTPRLSGARGCARRWTTSSYRARAVAESFARQLYQDSRPEDRRQAQGAQLAALARGGRQRALRKGHDRGPARSAPPSARAARFARDLGNLPPNICTPTYLGERAEALATELPRIKTKVFDEAASRRSRWALFSP